MPPTGRAEDMGLTQLWRDAADVLPLHTTTLADGTEVIGAIHIIQYTLEVLGNEMRAKRVDNLPTPLDFEATIQRVRAAEFENAVARQTFYNFTVAATKNLGKGGCAPSDSTRRLWGRGSAGAAC